MLERAPYVRRCARRGDADHEVAFANTALVEIRHGALDLILGALLRSCQRRVAARDDPLHHLGIGAVRGRHLGRIENAESAGRSRADVEQPAATAKGRFGFFDRGRNGRALSVDDVGDPAIFRRDEIHDLEW